MTPRKDAVLRSAKRHVGWFVLLLAPLVFGCVTTQSFLGSECGCGPVSQVAVTWESRMQVTQDSVNGGRPLPGLAGRMYLFGPDLGFTQKGNGTVTVDLFDTSACVPGQAQAEPKHLERWQFDAVSLNKLLRKDKIGWGYTLFLPWPTYKPEITRVRLNVCYLPASGTPLYAEPASLNLGTRANLTQTSQVTGR